MCVVLGSMDLGPSSRGRLVAQYIGRTFRLLESWCYQCLGGYSVVWGRGVGLGDMRACVAGKGMALNHRVCVVLASMDIASVGSCTARVAVRVSQSA